jgi:hypothetical protein
LNESIKKSDFVTVLAWIFIVLTGLMTFVTLLQNITIRIMFSDDRLSEAMSHADNMGNMPEHAEFMFNNFNLIFLLIFFFSLFLFITSIALLKRKNWARITFIILMALGILWNILGLILQSTFMPDISSINDPKAAEQFESMMSVMKIGSYVVAIVFTALYAWIIKKLSSSTIAYEFKST